MSGANLPGKPCALELRADNALRRTTGRRSEDVWCAADMPGFEAFLNSSSCLNKNAGERKTA